MIEFLAASFREGGSFMWVILGIFAIVCAVVVERAIFLYVYCGGDARRLARAVVDKVSAGDGAGARAVAGKRRTPVHVLLSVLLSRHAAGDGLEEMQDAVEESAITELPRYGDRIPWLALFANISTLMGLLGTITGLQTSFGSLGSVEASQKAAMLSSGISEAMNCTAFGLIVAVSCMVFHTLFTNRNMVLTRRLDEAVVRVMNYVKRNPVDAGKKA